MILKNKDARGKKGLRPTKWVKDLKTRPDMSIKVR